MNQLRELVDSIRQARKSVEGIREDPWLWHTDCAREAAVIEENRCSKTHSRFRRILDLSLKACAMRFRPSDQDLRVVARNTLEFGTDIELPENIRGRRFLAKIWTTVSRGLHLLYYVLLTYLTAKHMFIAILCYRHDKLLVDFRSSISQDRVTKDGCILLEELSEQVEEVSKIEEINLWAQTVGGLFYPIKSVGLLSHVLLASMAPVFFLPGAMLRFKRNSFFLDYIGFLVNPFHEIKILQKRIKTLATTMTMFSAFEKCKVHQSECQIMRNGTRSALCEIRERTEFAKIVDDIIREKDVKLFTISGDWHARLSSLTLQIGSSMALLSWLLNFTDIPALLLYDLYVRVSGRIASIKCKAANANSTSLEFWNNKEEPLKSSEHHDLYRTYDQSWSQFIILWLAVEPIYYFSIPRIVSLVEAYTLVINYAFWISSYGTFYIVGFVNQFAHIQQMTAQMENCIEATREINDLTSNSIELITRKKRILEKKLIISYICYEFFRQDHERLEPFARFAICQACLLTLAALSACYAIATNLEATLLSPIIGFSLGIVILMDIFLLTISYKLRKLEALMRYLTSLLAHLRSGRMKHFRQVKIWNRQLLTEVELQAFFSFSVFGEYLTYEKLISLNSYLMALWFLLIRRASRMS